MSATLSIGSRVTVRHLPCVVRGINKGGVVVEVTGPLMMGAIFTVEFREIKT